MIDTATAVQSYRARSASKLGRINPAIIAKGPAAAVVAKKAKGRAAYGEIAKTMAELRRAGLSLGAIATALNEDGQVTRNGSQFDAANVRRILSLYA